MFRLGIIGCGNISSSYLRNASQFADIEIVACADSDWTRAVQRADEFGIVALPLSGLLANGRLDAIINLTPPSQHADVSLAILEAGKHVYSEKPLAHDLASAGRVLASAASRGLTVCAAPDTFLGPGGQTARRLLDEGQIGTVVGGVAFFLSSGMEHWHPNPDFFYQPGGGPMLDMGPYYLTALVNLLGGVAAVSARAGTARPHRISRSGSAERSIAVNTPTSYWGTLQFEQGAQVLIGTSWDVQAHTLPHIELYGTEATLSVPDPDQFGGAVSIGRDGAWRRHETTGMPFGTSNPRSTDADYVDHRSLGVAEMAEALSRGRVPRLSAELGLHILEIMEAIDVSGRSGASVTIASRCERPAPFDAGMIAIRSA